MGIEGAKIANKGGTAGFFRPFWMEGFFYAYIPIWKAR